ncbi:hypothetical protein KY360_04815 [Candidatus Woesearchaeota archaeon]|nr:hypothetical protein [Candidatus Woesearchaeota archaeon]
MKKQIILSLVILAVLSVLSIGVSAGAPTVTLTSPGNDTWASSNQPDFVFTPVSQVNITLSCELFINDSTYGTNATSDNNTATTITASSALADGSYGWNINCTDSSSTVQSETRILKVDFTLPVITPSTPADNAYTNNDTVTYTPSDAFLNTCKWHTINTSNASDTDSGSASANNGVLNSQQLTLTDGSFYWYINCTDDAGNIGVSATRTINYDATEPVISSVASSASSSGATITWTTDESANSQVNYGTTTALGSTSSSASYTTSHSVGVSGSASTTYYYNVTSCDQAGNCQSDALYNFTTSAAPAPSTTTTTTTTSRSRRTASSTPPPSLNYYLAQPTKTVTLRTTDDVQFDVAGARHRAKIKNIHADHVTVTVSSTPMDVDLYVDKPLSIDLNDDGMNDIQLTLISFSSSNARIKFDAISEQVEPIGKAEQVPVEEAPVEEEVKEEVKVPEPKVEAEEEAEPFNAVPLIGILAAAAVIAGIIFVLSRKKK